jgi:steroid delta-isomerase-like uncharacterized protein
VSAVARNWGPSEPLLAHEHRNLQTMAAVEAAWNAHDVETILAHYDDGIVWRDVAAGRCYVGKDEVGGFLRALFAAVPDLRLVITRRIPRGELVAEEYTIRGTHLGTMFGVPATGRRLEISAVSFVRMLDGRFANDQFYFDVASLLRQMGLFPPLTIAEHPVGHAAMRLLVFFRAPHRAFARWRARRPEA